MHMGKKQRMKKREIITEPEEITFSKETEALYKRILRIMTWIVAVCFLLIIILPLFDNVTLDRFTRILFFIGIINLLVFTLLEFIGNSIKRILQNLTDPAQ